MTTTQIAASALRDYGQLEPVGLDLWDEDLRRMDSEAQAAEARAEAIAWSWDENPDPAYNYCPQGCDGVACGWNQRGRA